MALLAPTDAYCYAWKGMRLKHCVFKADHQGKPVGEPIKAEMDSKAEALAESLLPTGKTPLARLLQNKPRLTIFCHLPKINT